VSGPRENVFAAVTTALEAITVADGYGIDVDKVYRLDVVPDEMPSTVRVALSVLESLTPEHWEYLDHGASGGQDARLTMVIAGVIKQGTADLKSSDRHTQINALVNGTTRALMLDPTFGGACKDSVLSGPIAIVDTDKAEALFNMTLRCHYAFGWNEL
jgi:hypothetical protein